VLLGAVSEALDGVEIHTDHEERTRPV